MPNTIPIPARMRRLDRIGAEPNEVAIPWITARREDGSPIFSGNNEKRRIRAIVDRLCGQCGKAHGGGLIVFFGDDDAIRGRTFTEPAAHQECAEYAAAQCPFMSRQGFQLPEQARVEKVAEAQMAPWIVRSLPPEEGGMWLYFTRGYKILTDGPLVHALANAPVRIVAAIDRTTS